MCLVQWYLAPMPFCMSSISSSMPFFPLPAYLSVGSKCMQRNFTLAATILACKHFPRHGAKPANGIAYVFLHNTNILGMNPFYYWIGIFRQIANSTCSVFIITLQHTQKNNSSHMASII